MRNSAEIFKGTPRRTKGPKTEKMRKKESDIKTY